MNEIKDRLKGALYGLALGDSMGSTTEFMTKEQIKEKYILVEDLIGQGIFNLKIGSVTDDTQMSICIMRVLMRKTKEEIEKIKLIDFKKEIADEFIKWFDTDPKDIGKQCKKALSLYKKTNEFILIDNNALGNGSLMRALPCALLNTKNSYDLNIVQGEITHNNEICKNILIDYTKIIKSNILAKKLHLEKRTLLNPSGYIVNTFNNALYFSSKKTFKECIVSAVNDGGDADTIAAVASSISGSLVGFSKIDKKLVDKLNEDVKKVLDAFLEFVFKMY